jgi:hypothetical protein
LGLLPFRFLSSCNQIFKLCFFSAASSVAVGILRERGYFFGGPLPRWFNGDGLLMQKLLCPPDFEGIVLVSDFAKQFLEFIKEDWRRAAT